MPCDDISVMRLPGSRPARGQATTGAYRVRLYVWGFSAWVFCGERRYADRRAAIADVPAIRAHLRSARPANREGRIVGRELEQTFQLA